MTCPRRLTCKRVIYLSGCFVFLTVFGYALLSEDLGNQQDSGMDFNFVGRNIRMGRFRTVCYNNVVQTFHRRSNLHVNGSQSLRSRKRNEVYHIERHSHQTTLKSAVGVNVLGLKDLKINGTLRKWDKSHPIVFLHIGKNGGSSFDKTIFPIVTGLGGKYIGRRHFDWSHIDTIKNPDVVVLLRDPVSRAVSHFYFTRKRKTLKTKGNISEYIRNPQNMLETRGIWQDGQAAVSWLTGTHLANWVGIKPNQAPAREIRSLDHIAMCKEAAARLRQSLWFGFLSDQERSFELLQWQLGYSKKIVLAKVNRTPHSDISAEDSAILESLMPVDIWLYNYANRLFEARWKQYKTGFFTEPDLPPFPVIKCKSTRFILACNSKSPLGPLYHVWNKTAETTEEQLRLLPKHEWI